MEKMYIPNLYNYTALKLQEHSNGYKIISRYRASRIIGWLFPKVPKEIRRDILKELQNMNLIETLEFEKGYGREVKTYRVKVSCIKSTKDRKQNKHLYLEEIGISM